MSFLFMAMRAPRLFTRRCAFSEGTSSGWLNPMRRVSIVSASLIGVVPPWAGARRVPDRVTQLALRLVRVRHLGIVVDDHALALDLEVLDGLHPCALLLLLHFRTGRYRCHRRTVRS